nr:hypothetical protein BaRGS_001586 [Batillaria attramentaria]
MFLQAFMARGLLNSKEVKDLFRKSLELNDVQVPESEEERKRQLVKFIRTISDHVSPFHLDIRKGVSEDDGTNFYCLVNNVENHITKMASDYSSSELDFFKKLVEQIVENDGAIGSTAALNIVTQDKKLTKNDAQDLLLRLENDRWIMQMGFGMPTNMEDMEAMVYGDDDDDDLEAELAALTGEETQPRKASPKKKSMSVIEQMATRSMYEMEDDDEEVSDTEDPDLLDRIAMYQQAFDRAKATGDASKQRRLDRGLKALVPYPRMRAPLPQLPHHRHGNQHPQERNLKTAALQAKKNKDLELAKQHIRMMKGIEPMVEALEAGLPVDLAQVPPSPLANEDNEDKYVVVSAEECTPTGDREEVFTQLEQDLITQIRKLEQGCRKDLESLKSAKRHGDPVPKFHYETRSFFHSALSEGRKSVGGKLEVKIRVRDPFKGRQVEESKEKWLVIDQFIRTLGSKAQKAKK